MGDGLLEHSLVFSYSTEKEGLPWYNRETTLLSGSLAFALPHSLVEDLPSKGLCITFSCNQVPEKQQLREEGEAICLRFEGPPSIMVEKAGWHCHGVVGHILTAVRQQRKMGTLSFSFLFSPGL